MALGWATILLFGQVPESRRMLLSFITLGSLAWVATLVGVLVPDVGAFLVAAVPAPEGFESWVRLGMLAAALILPLLIGIGGLLILDPADRPKGMGMVVQILRGYLYAPVLAGVLASLFVEAPLRKLRSMAKRWDTAPVPMIVKPRGYDLRAARSLVAPAGDSVDLLPGSDGSDDGSPPGTVGRIVEAVRFPPRGPLMSPIVKQTACQGRHTNVASSIPTMAAYPD